jgi:hypothetical protein
MEGIRKIATAEMNNAMTVKISRAVKIDSSTFGGKERVLELGFV